LRFLMQCGFTILVCVVLRF